MPGLACHHRRKVAVLLDEPAMVHDLHRRNVVVDAVERRHPHHLAHPRRRHVVRAAGVELDESAALVARGCVLRRREGKPLRLVLPHVVALAQACPRIDFVDARQRLALDCHKRIAVAEARAPDAMLVDHVAGEENPHPVAPGADLVEVRGAEAPPHQLRVDRPHLGEAAARKKALDVGAEVAPRLCAVFVLHADPAAEMLAAAGLQGNGDGVTWLVGENAENCL